MNNNISFEGILGWHSHKNNTPNFLATEKELEKVGDDFLRLQYFGLEWEIYTNSSNYNSNDIAKKVHNILNDKGVRRAYFEGDSSIGGGFEIITEPFTKKYFDKVLSKKIQKVCDYLTLVGCKGHDATNCGIHIHYTRKGLTDDIINKMILFYNSNERFIKELSRRGFGQYNMSYFDKYEGVPNLDYKIKSLEFIDSAKDTTRYFNINTTNDNTIEFRNFKSTLNYSTICASIEFIDNFIGAFLGVKNYKNITCKKVVSYKPTKYLKEYLNNRGVDLSNDIYNKKLNDFTNFLKQLNMKNKSIFSNNYKAFMRFIKKIKLEEIKIYQNTETLENFNRNVYSNDMNHFNEYLYDATKIFTNNIYQDEIDLKYLMDELKNILKKCAYRLTQINSGEHDMYMKTKTTISIMKELIEKYIEEVQ